MKRKTFLFSKIKIALAGAALLLGVASANAQDFPQTAFGIKGGLNLTNFTKDDKITDEKLRAGFNAGIYGRFALTDGFSIQPEVLYATQGNKQTFKGNFVGFNYDYTGTTNLGYIQVPVLAVVNIIPNFNIHAGPYAGFLVTNKFTLDNNNNGGSNTSDINSDSFNKVDYGLAGGIGVDISKLHIGARYLYGLQNVGKDQTSNGFSYNAFAQKNSGFQIYLGIDLK